MTKPVTKAGPQFTQGWPEKMECLVIGGCADGSYLSDMRSDAGTVRLDRPKHIKPLANSRQSMPDIEKESDIYEIHVFDVAADADLDTAICARRLFGVAVIEGESMAWAWKQLVIAYMKEHLRKLKKRGGTYTTEH
jgi:hypothetical protein